MTEQSRHVPLRAIPWDADAARNAIDEIIADALAHFNGEQLWPAHPLDDGVDDGSGCVYLGAAGVVWGLHYLRREGATPAQFDFRPIFPTMLQATRSDAAFFDGYAELGSLLVGDMGTALVIMRLSPEPAVADFVYARASANMELPVRELMWGLPGSMLACIAMTEMTGETRWGTLFEAQAGRLLADLQETADGPIWVQDLYGDLDKYLGAVHGYSGNMIALMRGWEWLTESQRARVADAVSHTLSRNACRANSGVTWHAVVMDTGEPADLCQHCHGAPGMVATFADAPFTSPELEMLLLEGGKFTWPPGRSRRDPTSVTAAAAMAMRSSNCTGEQTTPFGSNAPAPSQ